MKRSLSLLGLCGLWVSLPVSAIVNIEAVRNAELEQGVRGEVGVATTLIASATDELRVDGNGRIDWLHAGIHDFAVAQGAYSELDGVQRRRGMLHARHVQAVNAPRAESPYTALVNWELFAQTARDDYASLRERSLAGTGVRLNRPLGEGVNHALGLGAMSEWRQMETDLGEINTQTGRANLYLTLSGDLGRGVAVGSTGYFQPRFSDFDDFSAIGEFYLDKALTEQFSIRFIAGVVHDSNPPAGVNSTRQEYGLRIVFGFGG